jgi:hypothetical protein
MEFNLQSKFSLKTILCALFTLFSLFSFAQPGSMSNNTDCDGSYGNNAMTTVGVGSNNTVFSYREQANATTSSGTKFYQFNADGYFNVWNLNTPTYNTVSTAVWGTGGYNGTIKMGATVSSSYYTFNIRKGTSYASQNMAILETAFLPQNITAVSVPSNVYGGQTATVSVTMSGALNSSEYLYVAWSTDAFATSGNSGCVAVGALNGSFVGNATIPAQISGTVTYYAFSSTSSSAPTFANIPLLTLNMRNATAQNTSAAYASYTIQPWTTQTGATTFSAGSSWVGGVAPSAGTNIGAIAINHNISLDQDIITSGVTIANGTTLTINNGNTLQTAGGITTPGTGSLLVNGTLQINSGGFSNIAPTYGSSSLLKYNSGSSYGRGTEWSATAGAGYPNNVQINNSTTLNLGANAGTGTARQCSGNLTINSGSTLSMNESGAVMTAALTVRGDVINNGTITLSGSGGGDLILFGNLDDNGSFFANARAIFFDGSNTQTINSSTDPLDIDVMRVRKTGGEIILAQNLVVDETGDPFQVSTAASVINLNGKNLTIGKSGTTSAISMISGSAIKCNAASSIIIAGNGALGTLRFDPSNNTLRNLTINAGTSRTVTLGSALNITSGSASGIVTVGSGSTLNTGGFLTLKSDASGTASIGNSAGTISGNVTAERYISGAGRKWRFLSTPVVGQTLANWGSQFYITGPGTSGSTIGSANSNGFATTRSNLLGIPTTTSSVRRYVESTAGDLNIGWADLGSNTSATLTPGVGYRVFIRGPITGNYSIDTLTIGSSANSQDQALFTLNQTGSITKNINADSVNLPVTFTSNNGTANDGWNLVGNPYPSNIDWNASGWTKTRVSGTFYIYTPNLNVYGSYDGLTGVNSINRYIPSGQSFFVKATAASPVLSLTESVKVSNTSPILLKTGDELNTLRIKLFKDSMENDETVIRFYEGKNDEFIDGEDVSKFVNENVNVASSFGNGVYSMVNYLSLNSLTNKVVKLAAWVSTPGSYKMEFNQTEDFDANVKIYLRDNYKNTVTNLRDIHTYTFKIDTSKASTQDGRLEIIFTDKAYTSTLENISDGSDVIVFPNPAKDYINIEFVNSKFTNSKIQVSDISGKEYFNIDMKSESQKINIENLVSGVYFVKITNNNGTNKTVKFVK